MLAVRRAKHDRPLERSQFLQLDLPAGHQLEPAEVAKEIHVSVGNVRDGRALARRQLEQRSCPERIDVEVSIRDGMPVRVARRVAE